MKILTLFTLAILTLVSCYSDRDEKAKIKETHQFNLLDTPWVQPSVTAEVGDLVELAVIVRQASDQYRVCGSPTIKDPYNNALMELKPNRMASLNRDELIYEFRYAFYAATAGEYTAFLDNRECDIAIVPAFATVTWTVRDSGWK